MAEMMNLDEILGALDTLTDDYDDALFKPPSDEPVEVVLPEHWEDEPQPEPEPEAKPEPEPEPVPAAEIQPDDQEVSGDTIRLDQIRKAVSEVAEDSLEHTAVFAAVGEESYEPPAPVVPAEPEDTVEPFSEEWEPEYDEPMGDYPAPEPIAFHPKARMKELRAKLVAGPEHRYYTLTELGLGKLQMSLILNLLVFAVSMTFMVLDSWGMLPPERIRLLVFVQFLSMLLSALLGCYRLMDGVSDIFHLRFSPNSLMVFTFIACCIDSVLCLQELRSSISVIFSLEMSMAIWAAYDQRSAEIGMMDTLRKATRLDSVVCVADYYRGKPGICTGHGEVEQFMDYYNRPSTPEKVLNWYSLCALVVSLTAGIMGGIRHGFSTGVQLCAASLLVGMPATAFLTLTRPLAILEKRLHRLGAVLCGWKGIRAAVHKAAYPLEDKDLFPAGAVRLNGMKFYAEYNPDLVLAYTTAMIKANRGALVSLFSQLLDSRNGYYYTVSNLATHSGGVTGEIGEDSVMVGTLEFMRSMGVDLSEAKQMDLAVYTAIDGQLAGVFAVNYQKSRSTVAGLRTLCGYPGLTPVVNCEDFMLCASFVQKKYGINPRRMAFPSREERRDMALREVGEVDTVIALTTRDGLAPKAFALTGARVLRSAMKTGVVVHMVGGIIGLLAMLAMAWVGPQSILTPSTILAYELIWMIPGLLITEWTRTL